MKARESVGEYGKVSELGGPDLDAGAGVGVRFEEACRAAHLSAQAVPLHCADVKRRCDSSGCGERVDRRSDLLTAD